MMSRNTTIALLVVNLALFAFIMVYERGTLSTSETAGRSGQVLTEFVRDSVERVELVRGDEPPIVLVRERTEDEEEDVLDLGTWVLAGPIEGPADQDAVDSLLGALEWLTAQRTLTEITAEDRGQFGLAEPRFTVRFQVREQNVEVAFGGEAPTGEGIYVGVVGEDRAHVVGDDIVEELDHDANHFRSKELFADFFASDARTLVLEGGGEPVRFVRDEGAWRLTAPVVGWARAAVVDGLLRVMRRARATRFVSESADDLAGYGLDEPWRELTATRPEEASGETEARLRVGGPCGEHAGERYAIANDGGPVVCVTVGDVSALEVNRDAIREERLLPVANDAIEKIVLTRGDRRLELRREEDVWRMYEGPADAPGEGAPADDAAIAEWTGALRDAEAVEFVALEGEPGYGLDSPRARITVHRSDRDSTLTLRLGDDARAGVWVRRGDENAMVLFPSEVVALFEAEPVRFRSRELLDEEPTDATRVTIRRSGREERAVKGEGGVWQLEAPIEVEADRVVVGALVRRFASLRAERLVGAEAAGEHGLGSPSAVVEVAFESEGEGGDTETRTLTLQLGASTPDGRFARLGDDGVVFVLGAESVDELLQPLASRDQLTVVTEELASLSVQLEGQPPYELTRDGTTWRLAAGGTPDEDRTDALVDRLGTLRAIGVEGYGPATRDYPNRVIGTANDGSTVTLLVGAPQGEGDDAWVPMRREGLDVTYRVRPDAARAILDYAP